MLPTLLLLGAAVTLTAAAPAQAGAGALAGTWTWTYPNLAVSPPTGPERVTAAQTQEQGTLSLGAGAGEWLVELPSALVGCAGGKPQYEPKAAQTALVETYPDGTCSLYVYSNGHYQPYWSASRDLGAGASAGPFWGTGDFH